MPQRKDYRNNDLPLSVSTGLSVGPVLYLGGLPQNVTLADSTLDAVR